MAYEVGSERANDTLHRECPKQERLVCLNFKVPLDFRKRLKVHAANHGITMTQLLIEVLEEHWSTAHALNDAPMSRHRGKEREGIKIDQK